MKGRTAVIVGVTCLLTLVAPMPTTQAQFTDLNESWSNVDSGGGLGFGQRIVGAWLGTGSFALDPDCDGVADSPPIPVDADVHSFDVGGSHIATNPGNPNLGQGTWKKTGLRQVSATDVVFLLSATDGSLEFIALIPIVFEFDHDYQTATSTFGAKLYLPTQDPLDPSESPVFCTVGQHDILQKVPATP